MTPAVILLQVPPTPPGFPIPPEAIAAAILVGKYFLSGCIILAVVPPILRIFTRRLERPPVLQATTPPDTAAQLVRIEQAVDAVAIEVERIAEAQRFSAKLAAEKARSLPREPTA
jgi:hypothetical protein